MWTEEILEMNAKDINVFTVEIVKKVLSFLRFVGSEEQFKFVS